MKLTEPFIKEQLEFAWWGEIVTIQPRCTYYFGSFSSIQEAEEFLPGYIEDLKQEGSEEMHIQIKHCQPKVLTIFDDKSEVNAFTKCYI